MTPALAVLAVVLAAYFAAHVASGWLARRFRVVSGAEYLLLGLLLGPFGLGLLSASVVDGLASFLTLAIGWVGLAFGVQLHLPELLRYERGNYRVAFAEAVLSGTVVGGVVAAALMYGFALTPQEAVFPAVAAGAIGAVSSPLGIALVEQRFGAGEPVVRQLRLSTAAQTLTAVTAFSILLCVNHVEIPGLPRSPTATEWVVITVALGIAGGTMFHLFLGNERHPDRLFVALIGAVILTSGAAAYLRLSPLLPALLVGAILVNTSQAHEQIVKVVTTVERPMYFVLLVFAGAAWRPVPPAWLLVVLLFLLARALAKTGAARLVARMNGVLPELGPRWGRAMLGQGGLAVAIGLNYAMGDTSVVVHAVFTAAVASVLFTDLVSARVADHVVRDVRRRRLEVDA